MKSKDHLDKMVETGLKFRGQLCLFTSGPMANTIRYDQRNMP